MSETEDLYFYNISYSDWDEHTIIYFYSYIKYSQEDFEEIIYKAYRQYLSYLIANEEESKCYPNIYIGINVVIYEKKFHEIIQSISELKKVDNSISGGLHFGRDSDSRLDDIVDDLINVLPDCTVDCIVPVDDQEYCHKRCLGYRKEK